MGHCDATSASSSSAQSRHGARTCARASTASLQVDVLAAGTASGRLIGGDRGAVGTGSDWRSSPAEQALATPATGLSFAGAERPVAGAAELDERSKAAHGARYCRNARTRPAPSRSGRPLPPPFRVYFDGHEAITMTVDHPPDAVLSTIDRRCPEAHFVCLAVDLAREVL